MLLTITQDGRSSIGGTFPQQSGAAQNIVNNTPEPIPSVPYNDSDRGVYGGLLYLCDAGLSVGDVVFAYGPGGLDAPPIRYVQKAYGVGAGPVLGVVTSKTRLTVAEVVHTGVAPVFRNLEIGKRYYLSADGTLTAPPLALDPMVYVHYVGFAVADDALMLQPTYPLLKRSAR